MAKARFGLTLYPADARLNQPAALSLSFSGADIGGESPLSPVEDNQRLVNHAIVTRLNGSSAEYRVTSGPYATSGAGSPGDWLTSPTVNVQSDSVLADRAAWLTHVGTADQDRYPQVPINLRRRRQLADAWLATGIGGRITADGTYLTAGQPLDVVTEGWTEELSRYVWQATPNCSPAKVYDVAVVGTDRVDTDDSALASGVTAGASTLSVSTTAGALLWTLSGETFDLNVGGYRVTCRGIAGGSSPQTFTVDPADVTNDIPAGAKVRLWSPAIVSLGDD